MSKNHLKDFMETFWVIVLALAILSSVIIGAGLRWSAYHQRYPNAAWWTMFFR